VLNTDLFSVAVGVAPANNQSVNARFLKWPK